MAKNATAPIPTPTQQLATVNPVTLLVRDQARADATPDEGLIASVRQHGILQPPIVAPGSREGTYVILFGHRRVGAAISAGMEQITVIVRNAHTLDSDALTLEEQLVENERRAQLTSKDIAAVYSKLALFGMRPEDIAASLGEKTERVRAGLKIVDSAKASELVTANPVIDFEQAAIIADFEEHPKLQKKLIDTATDHPANFQRDAEQAREERQVRVVVDGIRSHLTEQGVPVLQEVSYATSSYWTGASSKVSTGAPLESLADAEGNDLTPEKHQLCDGHAAVIQRVSPYYLDREDSPIEPFYVCTNWEGFGHQKRKHLTTRTPEQIELDEERQRQQQEREAHRQVVAANTKARRAWLHGYLTTGRLRPTATHFEVLASAIAISLDSHDTAAANITMQLLTGTEWPTPAWNDHTASDALVAGIRNGSIVPLRAIVADAIALHEEWLNIAPAVGYFAALESWGYALTDTDFEHIAHAQAAAAAAEDDAAEETTDNDEQDDA